MAEVRLLADAPDTIATFAAWYRAAWPDWFEDKPLDEVKADLVSIANRDALPLGFASFDDAEKITGVCSLRAEPFQPYPHAGPWLRGLYVHTPFRGHGIAGELIRAAETHAARIGLKKIYAATGNAVGTFERAGWLGFDQVINEQQTLTIFAKRLG
jgi:GNAT superfamily N-acetyltransferase